MLNKHLKKRGLRRSVSDVSGGNSIWKNMASVVTNLRSGGCYSETHARESRMLGKNLFVTHKQCQKKKK